jgi:hypothetical protein
MLTFEHLVYSQIRPLIPCHEEDLNLYSTFNNSNLSIENSISKHIEKLNKQLSELQNISSKQKEKLVATSYYDEIHDAYSGKKIDWGKLKETKSIQEEINIVKEKILEITKFWEKYKTYPEGCDTFFLRHDRIKKINSDIKSILDIISHRIVNRSQIISPESLEVTDLELCYLWANNSHKPLEINLKDMEESIGKYDAGRLISARIAEKSALSYFNMLKYNVEDVSIKQCSNRSNDWIDYDLLANEIPIDVKNARKSFTNPDSYVEHCVPHFKNSRINNAEVKIVGILSSYLSIKDIENESSNCLVLGWISRTNVRQIYKWMKRRFGEQINLDGVWNDKYFPGWMFEYPDQHYLNNDKRSDLANSVVREILDLKLLNNEIPKWIFSLATTVKPEILPLNDIEKSILSDLYDIRDNLSYCRPAIYLYALSFILSGLLSKSNREEIFMPLHSMIFTSETNPIGLDDSLNYISKLFQNLHSTYNYIIEHKYAFIAFKMTHPLILRGQLADNTWITVMAYCGGWRLVPFKVRCSAIPLIIGRHSTCPSCSLLICDQCGYCSNGCDLVAERQGRLNELESLRIRGMISDSEYSAKKQEILTAL